LKQERNDPDGDSQYMLWPWTDIVGPNVGLGGETPVDMYCADTMETASCNEFF